MDFHKQHIEQIRKCIEAAELGEAIVALLIFAETIDVDRQMEAIIISFRYHRIKREADFITREERWAKENSIAMSVLKLLWEIEKTKTTFAPKENRQYR